MAVNDKVWTDLNLNKGSNMGLEVSAIGSYPKVAVAQIWKQYLKQFRK